MVFFISIPNLIEIEFEENADKKNQCNHSHTILIKSIENVFPFERD